MSSRRTMLLSILNLEKYIANLFSNVYYSLIPSTISGKNVKDNGKIKLVEIQGNSVVENQLIDFENATTFFSVSYGTLSYSSGVLSYTLTAVKNTISDNRIYNANGTGGIKDHRYLYSFAIKCPHTTPIRIFAGGFYVVGTHTGNNQWQIFNVIRKAGTGDTNNSIYFECLESNGYVIGDVIEVKEYQKSDLTHKYPFDTPTALTDNRIVSYINEGYHSFNSGSIEDSVIGEICLEPYNLFDGILEVGTIGSNGQPYPNNQFLRTTNFIKVIGGCSYSIETNISSFNRFYYETYDKNQNFIKEIGSNNGILTLENDVGYIKFLIYGGGTIYDDVPANQTCFHRTGTRTGYAPHTNPTKIQLPAPVRLGGAINSHNLFTIYSDRYEFTRNISLATNLSSFTWTAGSENRWFAYVSQITNMYRWTDNTKPANMLCSKYPTTNADSVTSTTGFYTIYQSGGLLFIKDSAITQASDIQGELHYQLATPQVISIPKKHLGFVDLSSLTWNTANANGYTYVTYPPVNWKAPASGVIANLYCEHYMSDSSANVAGGSKDCVIGINPSGVLVLKDSKLANMTNAQIQAYLVNHYIFYETNAEVADFIDKTTFEKGGTINTYEFSWVENQLVNNGNFANTTGWYSASTGSISVSNNKLLFTKSVSSNFALYRANSDFPTFTLNHKYFVKANVKASDTGSLAFVCGNITTKSITVNANVETLVYGFATPTASGGFVSKLQDAGTALMPINSTLEISDYELIDLTLGFGAGKEPTSINDWRIQYIIKNGYIPTNTTGTNKSIQNDVLTNLNMKVQVK